MHRRAFAFGRPRDDPREVPGGRGGGSSGRGCHPGGAPAYARAGSRRLRRVLATALRGGLRVSDPTALGAAELAAAFATRTLSPVELVKALLSRIDRIDSEIHVFVTLDREGALRAARDAEAALAADRGRGPL